MRWVIGIGLCALGLAFAATGTAVAETSGIVFASNVYGSSYEICSFDPLFGSIRLSTRAVNAKHCISYGVIDWSATDVISRNTAGEQSRLANWDTGADDYESLGHRGTSQWNNPFRQTRGMVRYDEDTFLTLSTQYGPTNANGVIPPWLQQIDVHEDWYKSGDTTDDQYIFESEENPIFESEKSWSVTAASRAYVSGPTPCVGWDPNDVVDWTWVGGGATGVLQWPDGSDYSTWPLTVNPDYWTWSDPPWPDPNTIYQVVTGTDGQRGAKILDNAAGDLYLSGYIPLSVYNDDGPLVNPVRASSPQIDLEIWYGQTSNVIYTTQFEGRIYRVDAAKNLGFARLAGAPYPGSRVVGTDCHMPVLEQSDPNQPLTYATDYESGEPLLGDGPLQPSGAGTYAVELYSDAMAGQRHYTGLAVDAGGRVYAASQRLTENGMEVAPKFIGTGADVWGDYLTPGNHLLIDPNNAPFGTEVLIGDTVLLLAGGGTTDTTKVYKVVSIDDAQIAYLDQDPGFSLLLGNVTYLVYPPAVHPRGAQLKVYSTDTLTSTATVDGKVLTDTSQDFSTVRVVAGDWIKIDYSDDPNDGWNAGTYTVASVTATTLTTDPNGPSMGVHPITDPNYPTSGDHGVPYWVSGIWPGIWTSEALVDVYCDGAVIETIDLNVLARKDGVLLGSYWHDGTDPGSQLINGVVIHGDIEVDPTVSGGDVTRLWIACAGGDGNPDTNDGLDMVIVDVTIAADGSVASAELVGGIDSPDMQMGLFYDGSYNSGNYQPYYLWAPASDIEFDGLGNLVYMGNRGGNGNRYNGFTADAIATAVDTALDDPNELDGIVDITGLLLDMNIYGYGTDFGLAFMNSPLQNFGSATGACAPPQPPIPPDVVDPGDMVASISQPFWHQMELVPGTGIPGPITWALMGAVPGDMAIDANGLITCTPGSVDNGQTHWINVRADNVAGYDEETFGLVFTELPANLIATDPPAGGTLARTGSNCVFLTFDRPITVPTEPALSIIPCVGGANVGDQFTYSVEPDGITLKAKENGSVLANQTWYRVEPTLALSIAWFDLTLCTLIGDANGDGRVLAQDLGVIWAQVGSMTDCARQDVSGDGRVLAQDLGVAWAQVGSITPVKNCP